MTYNSKHVKLYITEDNIHFLLISIFLISVFHCCLYGMRKIRILLTCKDRSYVSRNDTRVSKVHVSRTQLKIMKPFSNIGKNLEQNSRYIAYTINYVFDINIVFI